MAYRMTKSERIARRNYSRDHAFLETVSLSHDVTKRFPLEWKLLAHDLDVTERKEKVTLYVDRSVARMYRGLGQGYQGVMNRVLRVWMQAKTAEWLEVEAMIINARYDEIRARERDARALGDARPGWDAEVEEWPEVTPEEG
ncbi:BrnA antitoxin family protein [Pseudooceanicola sp. LIPI14-2-Ac024]|uniref:BrnA antitoxin family protein n=1 Tax=Pseudooceanicola sp. LIPI14-2-Ac024 TaxID=3344875 RepID=UPI0035D07109